MTNEREKQLCEEINKLKAKLDVVIENLDFIAWYDDGTPERYCSEEARQDIEETLEQLIEIRNG